MAKILIVDDSSFQRRMIRSLLSRMGHEVVEADCGTSGLVALESERPDVLTLDLLMPEIDGYQVLDRLREAGAKVPRLVLTADVQDSAKQRCLELGAFCVLNKPPKEVELKKAIDMALSVMERSQ